jgi:hypothetical protein
MTTLQVVIWALGQLQMIALLAILIVRRHYQRVPIFTIYVVGSIALGAFRALNYTWNGFMISAVVTAALRFGVALELTRCIFGAFPAAATTARRMVFWILLVTAVICFAMTSPSATYTRVHAEAVPRLGATGIWILTALAGLVLWYRLPLAALPRAILIGYAPYLLVYTICMSLYFSSEAQPYRSLIGYVNSGSFMVVVGYWMWVAWGTAAETSAPQLPQLAPVVVPHQAS